MIVVGRGESDALVTRLSTFGEATASGTAIDDSDIRCTRVGEDAGKDNEPAKQTQVVYHVARRTRALLYCRARCDGASHPGVLARLVSSFRPAATVR